MHGPSVAQDRQDFGVWGRLDCQGASTNCLEVASARRGVKRVKQTTGPDTKYERPALPVPVHRGPFWELTCATCGKTINQSLSAAPDGTRHVESWSQGCAWVEKYYLKQRTKKKSYLKTTNIMGKFVVRLTEEEKSI